MYREMGAYVLKVREKVYITSRKDMLAWIYLSLSFSVKGIVALCVGCLTVDEMEQDAITRYLAVWGCL